MQFQNLSWRNASSGGNFWMCAQDLIFMVDWDNDHFWVCSSHKSIVWHQNTLNKCTYWINSVCNCIYLLNPVLDKQNDWFCAEVWYSRNSSPKNEKCHYSPSSGCKPVWVSFFCWTQNKIRKNVGNQICLWHRLTSIIGQISMSMGTAICLITNILLCVQLKKGTWNKGE